MANPANVPAENTRDRILQAALEIFAERGFDGAKTREIAARAGANLGLIQYYFGGKESLWKAAVDRAFQSLRAGLGESGGDVDERTAFEERAWLEQLVRKLVRFLAERPEFARLMNDEGKREGPRMAWMVEHHVGPLFEAMRPLISSAQANGVIPDGPMLSYFYILAGASGLVFSQAPEARRLAETEPISEAFIQAHEDTVVRLLFGNASPES